MAIFVRTIPTNTLPRMRIYYILILCFLPFLALAQQPSSSRADLEKRRQNILEAIKITQDQLEATKNDKKATMYELQSLQSKLAQRQKLINNINEEIGAINQNIQYSAQEIETLRQELNMLKLRYAQSVRYAYKNRSSYNMLAFLFSSEDFNQAIRRLKYLKKYREYRKQQADDIRTTHQKIEHKLGMLNTAKSKKDLLLSAENQQKQVIEKETNEKDRVVKDLKGRERELIQDIERNKRTARQVDAAINKVIMREIELARKKAEEERRKREADEARKRKEEADRLAAAKAAADARNNNNISVVTGSGVKPAIPRTNPPANNPSHSNTTPTTNNNRPVAEAPRPPARPVNNSYVSNLTPEVAALSSEFEQNRGRLPWPVDKGYIAAHFGKHQHEVAKKVEVDNAGIDIITNQGTTARAVFNGSVSKVFYVEGANWIVLISHGAFFSVYSGLVNVQVKTGQQVSTKQAIGTVGQNDDGVVQINFQIWKVGGKGGLSKVDPEPWIAR